MPQRPGASPDRASISCSQAAEAVRPACWCPGHLALLSYVLGALAAQAHGALHLSQQDGVAGPGGADSRLCSDTGRSVFAGPGAGDVAETCRRLTVMSARASGTTAQPASATKSRMATSLRAPATAGSGASWPMPQAANARTATSRMRAWRPLGG